MNFVSMLAVAGTALMAAAPAMAAFTLSNSLGGDGFVVAISDTRFDLYGSNDEIDDNIATYGTTAAMGQVVSGQFRYLTKDFDGSNFDPAGYFINNDFFQLSAPDMPSYSYNSGTFSFTVNPGDTYGFYVSTLDGRLGRGILTIGAVPEPQSWAMLIAGFGLVGAALRRRRSAAVL